MRDDAGGATAMLENLATGERAEFLADSVIFATSYLSVCPLGILGEAGSLCMTDDDGMVRVTRDYRIATTCRIQAGVYLQGATEHTHGIGSTLLSNTALRAGEIRDSVLRRRPLRSDDREQLVGAAEHV